MVQFPNRCAQSAIFRTGTPNYIDVSAGTAVAGMRTIPEQATANGWNDDDFLSVLVRLDDTNYQVWLGRWDASNEYVLCHTVEETSGTLNDDVTIIVTVAPTTASLARWQAEMSAAATLSY